MTIEARKELISLILAPRSENASQAGAHAEHSIQVWNQLANQITPLIGEVGFQSMYARAVQLALPECSGFTIFKRGATTSSLLENLKQDLGALDQDMVGPCSHILLGKFAELMTFLIGERLTEKILHRILNDGSNGLNILESSHDR